MRESRRRVERSGAFLGDVGVNVPVPIRTLADDYRDIPEPEDSDREPAPESPGPVGRLVRRIRGRSPRGA